MPGGTVPRIALRQGSQAENRREQPARFHQLGLPLRRPQQRPPPRRQQRGTAERKARKTELERGTPQRRAPRAAQSAASAKIHARTVMAPRGDWWARVKASAVRGVSSCLHARDVRRRGRSADSAQARACCESTQHAAGLAARVRACHLTRARRAARAGAAQERGGCRGAHAGRGGRLRHAQGALAAAAPPSRLAMRYGARGARLCSGAGRDGPRPPRRRRVDRRGRLRADGRRGAPARGARRRAVVRARRGCELARGVVLHRSAGRPRTPPHLRATDAHPLSQSSRWSCPSRAAPTTTSTSPSASWQPSWCAAPRISQRRAARCSATGG